MSHPSTTTGECPSPASTAAAATPMPGACAPAGSAARRTPAPLTPRPCWIGRSNRSSGPNRSSSSSSSSEFEVPSAPVPTGRVVTARRGHPSLGRHVVVRPGAPTPPAWHDATRITITDDDLRHPDTVIALLRRAAVDRTGLVIELDASTAGALAAPQRTDLAPHEAGPRFELQLVTLQHLLTSNAVDATGDAGPRWWVLDRAIAAGARPIDDDTIDDGTADIRADVVLPDGTPVWLDGGPPAWRAPIDGVAVLHRVAVEHGSFAPFGSNDTTADLAPDQLAAVVHDGGAARIIAPGRLGQDPGAHRAGPPPAPPVAPARVGGQPRRVQQAGPGGDARAHPRPAAACRCARSTRSRSRSSTAPRRSRRGRKRFETIDEVEVRRIIGRLVKFPRKRNTDPVATWIEALIARPARPGRPERGRELYDGDVDGLADVLPPLPRDARTGRRARLRRTGPPGARDPARPTPSPAPPPSGRAG